MHTLSDYFSIAGMALIDYIVFKNVFRVLYSDFKSIRQLIKNGNLTKGTIIGFQSKVDLDQRDQYAPIVSFIAKDGSEYITKSDDYKFIKAPLHSVVSVCYEIETPSNAIIKPQSILRFKVFLMLVVFFVMATINIGILYKIVN